MTVAVIGGGLFGSIIAKALHRKGHEVIMYDAPDTIFGHLAGSPPAACLMKPSWYSSLGAEVYEPALATLKDLYQVREIEFKVGLVKTKVLWIAPEEILDWPRQHLDVRTKRVGNTYMDGTIFPVGDERLKFDLVVIAAGCETNDIVPEGPDRRVPGLRAQAGVAFLYPAAVIEQPFISPWAPYKQLVAFNRGDGLWVSDGTALKPESLTKKKLEESRQRCLRAIEGKYVGSLVNGVDLIGWRPYVRDVKPAYFRWLSENVVVATGGAKNGTLAAGWCASEILKEVI